MRGPRFTAQMPDPQGLAQPDQAQPCACKSGMGFALTTGGAAAWPWETWLLVLVAAWLVFREFSDMSSRNKKGGH